MKMKSRVCLFVCWFSNCVGGEPTCASYIHATRMQQIYCDMQESTGSWEEAKAESGWRSLPSSPLSCLTFCCLCPRWVQCLSARRYQAYAWAHRQVALRNFDSWTHRRWVMRLTGCCILWFERGKSEISRLNIQKKITESRTSSYARREMIGSRSAYLKYMLSSGELFDDIIELLFVLISESQDICSDYTEKWLIDASTDALFGQAALSRLRLHLILKARAEGIDELKQKQETQRAHSSVLCWHQDL